MKKIILYGAGVNGRLAAEAIKTRNAFGNFADLVAFADRNEKLWGSEIDGVKVIAPSDIIHYEYDEIVNTVSDNEAFEGFEPEYIVEQLVNNYRVSRERITINTFNTYNTIALHYLESQAKIIYDRKMIGSVAECGVWRGEYAKYINYFFPDRTLYLFDTFSGFSEGDVAIDKKNSVGSDRDTSCFENTSVEYVRSKLPSPNKAEFRMGHFPETAEGLEQERFVFVRLDMDLYQPTLEGLKVFYPLLSPGGIIMIHDYFDYYGWSGVKKAVDEFCDENTVGITAVGDKLSVALVK